MSLLFQLESVATAWEEVMVLAEQHWAGTKSYRRHEPFKPSFERYREYNECGMFRLFTARYDGRLVGYFGIYQTLSMHSQLPMAVEDTFYLHPDHRGGRTALRFLRHVEEQLQAAGVHEVLFSCEIDNETGIKGLLDYLGYKPVIQQYGKTLIPISNMEAPNVRAIAAKSA